MTTDTIPAGYARNAVGHLVPLDQISEADKLRDEVARQIHAKAVEIHALLQHFKTQSLADVADLVSISAQRHGVALGGRKGNVQISSFDGSIRIDRQVADRITWTEEIEAAKELINQCITRWSEGANKHIRAIVDRAFRTDTKGQIKTTAVLELLRLDIDDAQWKQAMEALRSAMRPDGSTTYLRVYERKGDDGKYEAIPLDLAAV